MKKILLIITLTLLLSGCLISQNYFKIGTKYLQSGNYILADSFLTIHTSQFPKDYNSLYNLGIANLFLHDTIKACACFLIPNYLVEKDKGAMTLYAEYCSETDTIYYDKKFSLSDKENSKYYEVIFHHKYDDIITGKIHHKKHFEAFAELDLQSFRVVPYTSDIIGIYNLDSTNTKVYRYSFAPPLYPDGKLVLEKSIHESPYYQKAQEILNNTHTEALVNIRISKTGNILSTELLEVRPEFENFDELANYINLIYTHLSIFEPGKFRDEYVEFNLTDVITF